MKIKKILIGFITSFLLILIVSAITSYLYSLIAHGTGNIDWEMSFRFAIIFAIAFPAINEIDRRQKEKR